MSRLMRISPTKISDVLIVENQVHVDDRGFFMELWQHNRFQDAGIQKPFVLDSLSFSRKGVLRGIHFQNPNPQAKLISVLDGEIFDVAVDLRQCSPTFGKWVAEILSSKNHRQLFIPAGFGHGFCVLSKTAFVSYKMTHFFHAEAAHALLWNDPDIGIDWPLKNPILSAKDAGGFLFKSAPSEIFYA